MKYKKGARFIAARLEPGEEIISSLKSICKKEKIKSAFFNAIGAAKKADIAHYNPKTKKYKIKKLTGALEIVSLNGNVAMLKGEPAIHAHVCFSIPDFSTLSGHLMKAEVYPTCEIVLTPLDIRIERKFDKKTGLNLQSF